jgi:hypothetical protein
MDVEQRRALQRAARTGKAEGPQPDPEEAQRPTARPPPPVAAEGEVAIPKSQRVPAEALPDPPGEAPPHGAAPRPATAPPAGARSFDALSLVAFVLLAVAVAFELSR